jgi:hypothetical protein
LDGKCRQQHSVDQIPFYNACRRQRFRLRVEGRLQLNMPEYLFFKMPPDRIRHLLEGLDSVAGRLEQVGG